MKFLEKVKNMFTEEVEEDEDIEVESVKKEVTHVPIKSPTREEKYEKEAEEDDDEEFQYKSIKKESKPVFFDDDDFEDLNITTKSKVEETTKEFRFNEFSKQKNKDHVKEDIKVDIKEEKKIFKPTPIISPVYGILDKNYHKEDIVSRNEVKNASDESPIDTIRNKAYGTLEDELENTLFGSNSMLFRKDTDAVVSEIADVEEKELTDFTDDITKELDELIEKKDKKRESHNKKNDDEDLLGFIDSTLYKNGDE